MKKFYLNDLKINEEAFIYDNHTVFNKHHLESLGIIRGNKIKCLYHSLFHGPTAYLVKNTIVAIRDEDAKNIYIFKRNSDSYD